MAILTFKPHRLWYLHITEGHEDGNGDYHPGEKEWRELGECDAVPAGQAGQLPMPDGTFVRYSYTIYLPKCTREFHVGDKVRIVFWGQGERLETGEFTVKGFHHYQLQSKMWI